MMGGGRGGSSGPAISSPGRGGAGGSVVNAPPGRGGIGVGRGHPGAPGRQQFRAGGGEGSWRYGRSHFHRGPVVSYGFGAYSSPYYDYYYDYPNYQGADCWQSRRVRGRYRRVWVCD
jgi:hypothetical protein